MSNYIPEPSSTIPPQQPGNPVTSPPSRNDAASEALGRPSLSFDSNSGCARLTPLLSWNYFSLLAAQAYWYERPSTSQIQEGAVGKLPKGNSFTVVSLADAPDASSNVVGDPTPATTIITGKPEIEQNRTQLLYKLQGIGRLRNYSNSWVDQQSAITQNHKNNWFIPTNVDNAWREMATSEIATLSNTDSIPNFLIRTNYDYFKCGQDPMQLTDPLEKYSDMDDNLAAEYNLTSAFTLPENCSFAITFRVYNMSATSGQSADPKGKGYFRVYWSKYCFQFNGTEAMFCPDVHVGTPEQWTFHPVSGLKLQTKDNKELITLIFEVIGNHIVISNAIDTGDPDPRDKRPSWGYQDVENFDPAVLGLVVPPTNIVIGVRAMDIAFSYIPVVYPTKGTLSVSKLETGYSINNLRVNNVVDSHTVMGGSTNVTPVLGDPTIGEFGYTIIIRREATVDKSPALRSFELVADPTFTGIGISAFPVVNRIRELSLRLGLDSQDGTMVLDNRDGSLSSVGGIIPCEIQTGWSGDSGQVTPTTIFRGFTTNASTAKSSNQSHADFTLTGRDAILRDAIALNLPIYDGWDSGEAVRDLLTRGGWAYAGSTIEFGAYQLAVGALQNPVFMFPMGQSIMACIRDIARIAGYWAFVDCLGNFSYIEQSAGYGQSLGIFREVPTLNLFDEWQTLSGVKDVTDVRNAVLVCGLQVGPNDLPIRIAAVRTDPGGTVGNYLSDTLIPWLRWQIYQDSKINTVEAAQKVAEQMFQNANRLRLTTSGMVWGHPSLIPWQKIGIQLRRDDVGIPGGAQWRIISASHSVSGETGNYTTSLECEYIDGRYTYADWFSDGE